MSSQSNAGKPDASLRQYLIEEFLEDYQHGQMTRRDALKRIAGILGSVVMAESLLTACAPAATPAPTTQPTSAPLPTQPPAIQATPTAVASTAVPAATPTAASTGATGVTVPPDDPDIKAGPVQFPGQGATILAYLALPKGNGPFPAVLVCHENRGLLEHHKDVARRLAKAGYAGLAVDLLSRQGGTDQVSDPAQAPGLLANAPAQQLV
jgi:carboxymethylenebutenolidase